MNKQSEELITPATAAKMLGVTVMTIRNWENDGKLKAIKTLGGHRRFNLFEIKKMIGKRLTSFK